MLFFKNVENLKHHLTEQRLKGNKIGFVPTMGALHAGHISLIRQAQLKNQVVVCSIFVNPTQFNDPEDLKKYPRTETLDIFLLEKAACSVLFHPPIEEIYPKDQQFDLDLDLKNLDRVMEGQFRPGHFHGVMQVVKRLLDIVEPDELLMGQKDFQQFAVIKNMIEELNLKVKLTMGPTFREPDGLAMSSRNVRLSSSGRKKAPLIFDSLAYVKRNLLSKSIAEWQIWVFERLKKEEIEPEYFEIVDEKTLQPVKRFEESFELVACIAAWIDGVRLIDNIILNPGP